jgi:hypothetical protein
MAVGRHDVRVDARVAPANPGRALATTIQICGVLSVAMGTVVTNDSSRPTLTAVLPRRSSCSLLVQRTCFAHYFQASEEFGIGRSATRCVQRNTSRLLGVVKKVPLPNQFVTCFRFFPQADLNVSNRYIAWRHHGRPALD